jgi:hypothetical protein
MKCCQKCRSGSVILKEYFLFNSSEFLCWFCAVADGFEKELPKPQTVENKFDAAKAAWRLGDKVIKGVPDSFDHTITYVPMDVNLTIKYGDWYSEALAAAHKAATEYMSLMMDPKYLYIKEPIK